MSTNLNDIENDLQVIWGAAAIGKAIGINKRKGYVYTSPKGHFYGNVPIRVVAPLPICALEYEEIL
jgi:hypothetical protein